MCTLTYIPTKNSILITSSRDEKVTRKNLAPEEYILEGKKIFFSKDLLKGGTWLAMHQKTIVCLLNGGDSGFDTSLIFSKSRGEIVLKRFQFQDNISFFNNLELENTAPFTLVIFSWEEKPTIEEIIWDGKEKLLRKVDESEPRIWSSSTLYSPEVKEERKKWFSLFLKENPIVTRKKALHFHLKKHTQQSENNILMKREDNKQTTSVSQIEISETKINYDYYDVTENFNAFA